MPILWKYLLKGYFQFLFLCVSAFVAILLVIRFQEIALFASSGAKLKYVVLFSLYQIPYILPIALPISCLIASMILFQRMSASLELTALRACGIGLKPLAYPLLWTAFFISLINFYIASEITPIARISAKNLIYEIVSDNPLILMQKDSMIDLKALSFDLKHLDVNQKAEEVLCIVRQPSSERIGILTAKELFVDKDFIYGNSLSILSSADSSFPGYDHLVIENQKSMQMDKSGISTYLLNAEWFAKEDLLSFHQIIAKCYKETSLKSLVEILRRFCLGFCPITFTLIGIAFGTNISRRKKKHAVLYAFALAFFVMICFIATKALQKSILFSFLFYLIPQPIAALISLRSLSLSSKGVE